MGLRVAIIGLSPSRELAPWCDQTIEKWGMAWDSKWCWMDRLFEMHDIRLIKGRAHEFPARHLERLRECHKLYMQEVPDEVPNATPYPIKEVGEALGAYWNSSVGYMLALAIFEGAEEIQIYGVDMKGHSEYEYQRPNAEYFLGIAKARGIKVTIAPGSALLTFAPICDDVERYGYLG